MSQITAYIAVRINIARLTMINMIPSILSTIKRAFNQISQLLINRNLKFLSYTREISNALESREKYMYTSIQ